MRQATSHPSLVAGVEGINADALEPAIDESLAIKDSSQKTDESNDLDDLIGGLNKLTVAKPIEPEKKSTTKCVLCDNSSKGTSSYCAGCAVEMAKYGNLKWSTKIRQTMRILEEIREGKIDRKTIIFSQVRSFTLPLSWILIRGCVAL